MYILLVVALDDILEKVKCVLLFVNEKRKRLLRFDKLTTGRPVGLAMTT